MNRSSALSCLLASFCGLGFSQSGPGKISLTLYPMAVFAGQPIRLTCRVPRHETNRKIGYGIVGLSESEKDLDGERSAVTHQVLIERVECGASTAFCAVGRNDGTVERVALGFRVLGCDEP